MIILIACLDMNNGIGDNSGNLLFEISEDMKHFRETTENNIVVFGRKTAESLPNKKPLPNRRNILLTRSDENSLSGFETVTDINYILELSKDSDVYICGGGEIYEIFMPHAEKMVLTQVHAINMNAEVFFPDFTHKDWLIKDMNKGESDNPSLMFATYLRK